MEGLALIALIEPIKIIRPFFFSIINGVTALQSTHIALKLVLIMMSRRFSGQMNLNLLLNSLHWQSLILDVHVPTLKVKMITRMFPTALRFLKD
jgi:hypothetical protein